MKGDFSKWNFNRKKNFNGILHQQGRVLLDSDWNAQTAFRMGWQDQAGRDTIGADVGAVPVTEQDSFKIHSAKVQTINNTNEVVLKVNPGRIWADGLLTYLPDKDADTDGNITRVATYFGPPLQDPKPAISSIGTGKKDAVVLEVWREAINGFQMPDLLIEPALGGVDTTERVQTAFAFRLLRLGEDEGCKDVIDKVKDAISKKGNLAVSLAPSTETDDECPTAEEGGYSGFEHHLYRIEIALVNSSEAMFKWSQFNGGLVGRGIFKDTESKVVIKANKQAIVTSGLEKFYLEAVQYDPLSPAVPGKGQWRVTYGAEVTLNADNELDISNVLYGTIPPSDQQVFFRLWNGIEKVSVYKEHQHKELRDGIRLDFEDPAVKNYIPGDYWTFSVRVGQKEAVLIGKKKNDDEYIGEPPAGIHYHRVPLAVLHWDADKNISFEEGQIDDCREIFRPLTNQNVCCTFLVGDGKSSHGDFDSIEEALRHLPKSGGMICLLPGVHEAFVFIDGKRDITIKGCGKKTIVRPREENWKNAIFRIKDSKQITLENISLASPDGTAIFLEGTEIGKLSEINVFQNHILALEHAVCVVQGVDIGIRENKIRMLDKKEGEVAIFIMAEDSVIERNEILIITPEDVPPPTDDGDEYDPFDECLEPEDILRLYFTFIGFVLFAWDFSYVFRQEFSYEARGGIQIGSTSERVKVVENMIIGGAGNGITLGHIPIGLKELIEKSKEKYGIDELPVELLRKLRQDFKPFLYAISIEENTIRNMGLNGIGVINFFNLKRIKLLVSVLDLTIYRNDIRQCLQQVPKEIPASMKIDMGFAGISLADTENCMIRENRIENNGRSHLEPVSGIFIMYGEEIEISDNRILNNAPRTTDQDRNARPGVRGGIVIGQSFRRVKQELIEEKQIPLKDGIPAVKIHDNIVTQPLGQALFILALGPVSVVGNTLTSQGADFTVNPTSLLAATILIHNLGVSKDYVGRSMFPKFRGLANAKTPTGGFKSKRNPEDFIATTRYPVGRIFFPNIYLPSGNVLFSNNQVTLDLRHPEIHFALSSQAINTLDDVSYVGNQSEITSYSDIVLSDVMIKAVTIRTNDNRFQEGLTNTIASLFSYGFMNTCVTNQATHCLYAFGNRLVNAANLVVYDALCSDYNIKIQGHLQIARTVID